ncbi:MAG: hypothetical protein ACHQ2Y_01625 [Candidatus Lutacidiplasmatales archaeon]
MSAERTRGRLSRRNDLAHGRRHLLAVLALSALSVASALVLVHSGGSAVVGSAGPHLSVSAPSVVVTDGQSASFTNGFYQINVTDTLTSGPGSATVRSYYIHLAVSRPVSGLNLEVTTNPVWGLSTPDRNPGGALALPPLNFWSWQVFHGSVNDTQNWTVDATGTHLLSLVAVANSTFQVVGESSPSTGVSVNVGRTDGTHVPGVSFMMINPGSNGSLAVPWNDTNFATQIQALHPTLIRLGQTTAAPTSWNNTSQQPSFGMRTFIRTAALIHGVGAGLLLSMPAGSWGDGNFLPAGMPLNTSIAINWAGHGAGSGYFPSDGAYYAYISTFVNATIASNISVRYWNIGNEVPVKNGANVTAEFTRIFNIASLAIHQYLPNASVGTDVMLVPTSFPYFAAHALNVGYLSFHYYPVNNTCPTMHTYCVPYDSQGYWRDASMWAANHSLYGSHFLAPASAQSQWFNLTGHHVPVLATESNMAKSPVFGTDPRQQMLFGATWLINSMMDAARQNLTSYTYYTLEAPPNGTGQLSAPYGGWGWGMLNESSNDTGLPYAPYWALSMWGSALPAGASGVVSASADPSLVRSYACLSGTNASLVMINKVDVPMSIPLSGVYALSGTSIKVTTLDQSSYLQVYNQTLHREQVLRSGTSSASFTGTPPVVVQLSGYGVAVVSWTPGPSAPTGSGGSTSGSGGGSSGSGGGNGSGTGNGSSGNGSSTGSTAGNQNNSGSGAGSNGTGNNSSSGTGGSSSAGQNNSSANASSSGTGGSASGSSGGSGGSSGPPAPSNESIGRLHSPVAIPPAPPSRSTTQGGLATLPYGFTRWLSGGTHVVALGLLVCALSFSGIAWTGGGPPTPPPGGPGPGPQPIGARSRSR